MERILSLVDEGTFIETEAYVQHRSVMGTMNLNLSLIHISEPTRLLSIGYCL